MYFVLHAFFSLTLREICRCHWINQRQKQSSCHRTQQLWPPHSVVSSFNNSGQCVVYTGFFYIFYFILLLLLSSSPIRIAAIQILVCGAHIVMHTIKLHFFPFDLLGIVIILPPRNSVEFLGSARRGAWFPLSERSLNISVDRWIGFARGALNEFSKICNYNCMTTFSNVDFWIIALLLSAPPDATVAQWATEPLWQWYGCPTRPRSQFHSISISIPYKTEEHTDTTHRIGGTLHDMARIFERLMPVL